MAFLVWVVTHVDYDDYPVGSPIGMYTSRATAEQVAEAQSTPRRRCIANPQPVWETDGEATLWLIGEIEFDYQTGKAKGRA